MLKKILILLFVVICISPVAALNWDLLILPYNEDSIMNSTNTFIEDGYIPVGIEIEEGEEVYILFVEAGNVEVTRWALYTSDYDSVDSDFTEFIRQGFYPSAISFGTDGVTGIFLQTNKQIDRCRILPTEISFLDRNLGSYNDNLEGWYIDQLMPNAVGKVGSEIMTLLIDGEQLIDFDTISLQAYANNTDIFMPIVKRTVDEGFTPWGFTLDRDVIYFLYVK